MTDEEKTLFDHFDKIRDTQKGETLLVKAPINVWVYDAKEASIDIPAGASLRVIANNKPLGPVECHAAIEGRVLRIAIRTCQFNYVERVECEE